MIPVLCYHAVSEGGDGNNYVLPAAAFSEHLGIIASGNYRAITAGELFEQLKTGGPPPGKTVMLTFDDGSGPDYSITLPMLKEAGRRATFFVTTDWIGKAGYMDAGQLRALRKEGMEVHSHAGSHAFLDGLSPKLLRRELAGSREKLEDILGEEVRFISLPGGRFNKRTLDYAAEAGYRAVYSSAPFYLRNAAKAGIGVTGAGISVIGRVGMKQSNSRQFERIIGAEGLQRNKLRLAHYGKGLLKKLSGGLYYSVWAKFNRAG